LFELQPFFGGSGELAFGQSIHTVVFDYIHHRHVAPDQVLELPHANAGAVAIAADADAFHGDITKHGAQRERGHAPVHAIEAKRAIEEIGGTLARAADTAELDHVLRHQVEFKTGRHDL